MVKMKKSGFGLVIPKTRIKKEPTDFQYRSRRERDFFEPFITAL